MTKMSKEVKKKIFIYTNEVFNSDLLVIVGVKDFKDIEKYIKKEGTPRLIQLLKGDFFKLLKEMISKNTNFLAQLDDKEQKMPYYCLYLRKYGNDWEDINKLLHEIVHYKQFQFDHRKIEEEREFEAYFIESMFQGLRNRLYKEMKLK